MSSVELPVLTFEVAMRLVGKAAELRGVDPLRVAKRERTQSISYTRFGVVWVMRQMGFSLKNIGKALNFTDHTSVIHAERRAAGFREADLAYRAWTNELMVFALSLDHPKRRAA